MEYEKIKHLKRGSLYRFPRANYCYYWKKELTLETKHGTQYKKTVLVKAPSVHFAKNDVFMFLGKCKNRNTLHITRKGVFIKKFNYLKFLHKKEYIFIFQNEFDKMFEIA